ncbi:MAG: hypothetical protein ACLTZY_01785 [Alistipes indistinctus]
MNRLVRTGQTGEFVVAGQHLAQPLTDDLLLLTPEHPFECGIHIEEQKV